ncbi:MAG: type II toxin-antitoxin system death-on-curing family toxin [Candidatus Parabeggiatoa sp. nov. 1]|nr:MAG: type II toxin-antitoxin system death-on-curing family toxin [Gammaproteobacteria bacterium]
MAPDFLSLEYVLEQHTLMIVSYGGSHGVRDMNGLDSALNMPKASFASQYLHTDLYAMAAAYLFHIVQNHPFIDGNKRTGTFAALAFLDINGIEIKVDPDELADLVLSVTRGEIDKEQIATYLRRLQV